MLRKTKGKALANQDIFKAVKSKRGEMFIGIGIKILIAVVLGALMMGGLFTLTRDNVMATTQSKVESLFDYSGNHEEIAPEPITGDINGDDVVDNTDLDILRSELFTISGNYETSVLDMNGDGNVDIMDTVRLKKIISQQS